MMARVLKESANLVFLQVMNYLLNFLMVPYAVRVLGVQTFGLISYAAAVNSFFILLIEYGFSISAVQKLSCAGIKNENSEEIILSIINAKLLLLFISVIVYSVLILSIDQLRKNYLLFLLSFLPTLSSLFNVSWNFIVSKQTGYLVKANVLGKILILAAIFLFVHNEKDFNLFLILNGGGVFLINYFLFMKMKSHFQLKIKFAGVKKIWEVLTEGSSLFFSSLASGSYVSIPLMVLGMNNNLKGSADFAVADKIRSVIQSFIHSFTQAVTPDISALIKESFAEAKKLIYKSLIIGALLSLITGTMLLIGGNYIVNLLFGSKLESALPAIYILALVPFFSFMSNLVGFYTMPLLNLSSKLLFVTVFVSMLNLAVSLIIVTGGTASSAALSLFITEFIAAASMFYFVSARFKKLELENN